MYLIKKYFSIGTTFIKTRLKLYWSIMPKYNRHEKIDKNIINAIVNLPKEMKNCDDNVVTFRRNSSSETREEHIADSTHNLQVKDIKQIPKILLKPFIRKVDPNHPRRINYYGIKYKNNIFFSYIKIVTTRSDNNKHEEIITVYICSKIK